MNLGSADSGQVFLPDSALVQIAVDHWLEFERQFASNNYDGIGASGECFFLAPTIHSHLLLTAVHSVNHMRNGEDKVADRGTGGLALALAEVLGCGALVLSGRDESDGNHALQHPLKSFVEAMNPRPTLLVDLHGMRGSQVSLELGTGLTPHYPRLFLEALHNNVAGLSLVIDGQFNASRMGTMTSWAQSIGIDACQVEIASNLRPPIGQRDNLAKLASVLISALQRQLESHE